MSIGSTVALFEERAAEEPPRLTWRGPWQASAQYVPGDVVESAGSAYVAIEPTQGQRPPGRAWQVLAKKGDPGPKGEIPDDAVIMGGRGGGGPQLSNVTPVIEAGSGAAGTGTKASRDDHEHPAFGGSGIPQGGPLTEDLYTGGFNVGGEEDGAATGSYLQTADATNPNGGDAFLKGGVGDAGGNGGAADLRGGDVGTGGIGGNATVVAGETDDGGTGGQFLAYGGNGATHGKVRIRTNNSTGSAGDLLTAEGGGGKATWVTPAFDAAGAAAAAQAASQPLDSDLTAIAALVSAANKLAYATGAGTWSLTDLSAFARSLLDDANAAASIATLGLDADIATLSLPASTTISAFGATLTDDADAATALATLGTLSEAQIGARAVLGV